MLVVLAFVAVAVAGCGGGGAETAKPVNAPAIDTTAVVTLGKAPDSGQVDRIGAADGALAPDGVKDLSFVVEVDGAIESFFLLAVDESGKANGAYQADTLVGEAEVPKDISIKWGKGTAGLGVAEGDKLLNAPDGSVAPIGPGHHKLVFYVSASSAITPGTRLRAFMLRPDKAIVASNILTHQP